MTTDERHERAEDRRLVVALRTLASGVLARDDDLADRLMADIVLRHVPGRRVVDFGAGAPGITPWVSSRAASLVTLDLAHDATQPSDLTIPVPDASVDTLYSLRTFSYLGANEEVAPRLVPVFLSEISRVLAPGGSGFIHVENAHSLLGLLHGVRRPMSLFGGEALTRTEDGRVLRLESLAHFMGLLPSSLYVVEHFGIVVFVPIRSRLPVLGRILGRLEWWLRDTPGLRNAASSLLVHLRRRQTDAPSHAR